jgi:hypothetical protein
MRLALNQQQELEQSTGVLKTFRKGENLSLEIEPVATLA